MEQLPAWMTFSVLTRCSWVPQLPLVSSYTIAQSMINFYTRYGLSWFIPGTEGTTYAAYKRMHTAATAFLQQLIDPPDSVPISRTSN